MKPLIGIITVVDQPSNKNGIGMNYINAVKKSGGIPLLLPITDDAGMLRRYADLCDGFLFSGGIDVTPSLFGEQPHPMLGETSLALDRYQIGLAKEVFARKKPYLAICRGIQLINVACGGTLYQDIREAGQGVLKHQQATPSGEPSHLVSLSSGSFLSSLFGEEVWTNSYHHQSVKLPGKGQKIVGMAKDGIVEAMEAENYPFGVSVQWHPEVMLLADDGMLPLFQAFVSACFGGEGL